MNIIYKSVFDRDFTGSTNSLRAMQGLLQDKLDILVRMEQKKREPRQRKHFERLPKEEYDKLVEEVKNCPMWGEQDRLAELIKGDQDRKERLLQELYPKVRHCPIDQFNLLKTSSSYSYATQGYGAMKYAEGVLSPLMDFLPTLGYSVHLRKVRCEQVSAGHSMSIDHATFELWANCELWAYDAAKRSLKLPAIIQSLKDRQINPLVYHPGLPDWCRL